MNKEIMENTFNRKKGTRSIKKDNVTNLNTEEKNYYAFHAGKSSFDCRLLIILTVELNTYAANRFVIPIMHVQTWHKFQILTYSRHDVKALTLDIELYYIIFQLCYMYISTSMAPSYNTKIFRKKYWLHINLFLLKVHEQKINGKRICGLTYFPRKYHCVASKQRVK